MAKQPPSNRAKAFLAWVAAHDTNTKRVAERAGVSYQTLASFVQGATQSLKGENEEKIARAHGCSVEEMFAGMSPTAEPMVRIVGKVGADAGGELLHASGQAGWDMAPLPIGGSPESVAVEVTGHSMRGWADDGSLIYYERLSQPTPDLLGEPVVVQTEDGRVLFKRLLRGSSEGLYDLESANGPTLRDMRLVWVAEIIQIIPRKHAQRVIRRA